MSYEKLRSHFRRIGHFEELAAIANWDEAVNMPAAAGARRSQALASLSSLMHSLVASPLVEQWVEEAKAEANLSPFERANVKEIARLHRRATALPEDLVEETTLACKESELAWRRYRAENDFASYLPYLERVVLRKREVAAVLAEALGTTSYDALMDAYDPGMRTERVDRVFAQVHDFIPGFIDEVLERQKDVSVVEPKGPFAAEEQRELGLLLMSHCGLDMSRVRLDESHHPFCGGVPDDVRITNRYQESEFLSGLMGVLHESGHAKYEQNLPGAYLDQPVGKARGMVLHESQSLLQEMQVSRGRDYIVFLLSTIRNAFPHFVERSPEAYTVDNFVRLQTRVKRGYIRVNADEVTYPAHILLRYDVERRLIAGSLAVFDLPEAWNESSEHYLGLTTRGNDADGCLQDVHWPSGAFGYFPLYTLGAMAAAQLFQAASRSIVDLPAGISSGCLVELDAWLRTNVWSLASSRSTDEIMELATGSPLEPRCYLDHLRARYGQ